MKIILCLILNFFLLSIAIASDKKPIPLCSSDSVYYYNLFVICYNDKNFCQQKSGVNCWDFCSEYIGCQGPLGKIFNLPGDSNNGKAMKGTRESST